MHASNTASSLASLPTILKTPRQLLELWQLRQDALHGAGSCTGEGLLRRKRAKRARPPQREPPAAEDGRERGAGSETEEERDPGATAAELRDCPLLSDRGRGGAGGGRREGKAQEAGGGEDGAAAGSDEPGPLEEGSQGWPVAAWYIAGQVGGRRARDAAGGMVVCAYCGEGARCLAWGANARATPNKRTGRCAPALPPCCSMVAPLKPAALRSPRLAGPLLRG